MSLTKRQLVHHLELALKEDDKEMRRRVNLLLRAANRKPPQPGVPKLFVSWSHTQFGGRSVWDVTLNRNDAKTVEEVFADFRSRKKLTGNWKTYVRDGKVVPIAKEGPMFTFRFREVRSTTGVPKSEKITRKKKVSKEELVRGIEQMDAAGMAEVLKKLSEVVKKK